MLYRFKTNKQNQLITLKLVGDTQSHRFSANYKYTPNRSIISKLT